MAHTPPQTDRATESAFPPPIGTPVGFLDPAFAALIRAVFTEKKTAPAVTPRARTAAEQVEKVIIAIHGIGDQVRNDTCLATTVRFCDYYGYPGMVPLGAFHHAGDGSHPGVVLSDPPPVDGFSGKIGFTEAHWADIARKISEDHYTLQETKAWARSIVNRIRVMAAQRGRASPGIDYRRIRLIIEEIIDALAVIESLLFLTRKAGLTDFELKRILDAFLGDVQLVTDFAPVRAEIVRRFQDTLATAAETYPNAEFHLVAHSEGTVVAFLGLLEAADQPERHPWINRVRGFMTLGSPIDKHLILWPGLFDRFRGPHPDTTARIRWMNYADYADPIGFELDTAKGWLLARRYSTVFDFAKDAPNDFAFRRYLVPGKAHVDYWGDPAVFDHFIRFVVDGRAPITDAERKHLSKGPPSKWWVPLVTHVLAYLVPLALVHLGVYILIASVGDYLAAGQPVVRPDFIPTVLALSWLVAGTTVWLRMLRLTGGGKWAVVGGLIYAASVAAFFGIVGRLGPRDALSELGWLERFAVGPVSGAGVPTFLATVLVILAVVLGNLPRWRRR